MPESRSLGWASLLLASCFISFSHSGVVHKEVGLSEETLAWRINAFGCNLLNGLFDKASADENILVSPVNTYTALSLVHLGAKGDTLDELAKVMKVSEFKNHAEIHERLHGIIYKLAPQNESEHEKFHETALANGLYVRNSYPIKQSYVDSVNKYYGFDEVKNVDFSETETTDEINEFISRSTKGRIPKFYDYPIDRDTTAILTSALYFNAKWSNTFNKMETKTEKFNTGSMEMDVPMMSMTTDMYYVNDNTHHYESVSLPYAGKEYEMTIFLQHTQHGDHGSLAELFHQLTENKFHTKEGSRSLVHLKLPKMKFSWKKSVVEALKLNDIFSRADLGEMTPEAFDISDMIHATEIEVDEEGTIASAVTAFEFSPHSAFVPHNKEPVNFYVDRPFVMTITHKPTQAILFTGIVHKPTY